MLRYLTSGESHGKCMVAILDGLPAGLKIDWKYVSQELLRRKLGRGRGRRMAIEHDMAEILSGVRKGISIGSPITIMVQNIDFSIDKLPVVHSPRPGHADLTGAIKYGLSDIRSVLERASARDTLSRVCVGAVCKLLLQEFDIRIISHVINIAGIEARTADLTFDKICKLVEGPNRSNVRCVDLNASKLMCDAIDRARNAGDTLGGIFEIVIDGIPPGLGSYTQWDRRLDGVFAKAVMSIQGVKGVSFGLGFKSAELMGSHVHDEIFYDKKKGFFRKQNNAGGLEGGMTNGEGIIIRAVMKPIPTLKASLSSVDIKTKRPSRATVERSDVCVVPSAGVIGEAVCAFEIANALLEKFGGDSIREMQRNYAGYMEQVRRF